MPEHANEIIQLEDNFIEQMKDAIRETHQVGDEPLNRLSVERFGDENGAIDRYINSFMDHTSPTASTEDKQAAVDYYKDNRGALPPAFTDRNGKISMLDVHPDFHPNGNQDTTLYKSVLIHEAMHSVSMNSQGLQQHSGPGQYNWDEAVTDYLAEQVARNDQLNVDFRSNYYTNTGGQVNTIQLRNQMGSTFAEAIDEIKHSYFNSPGDFNHVLERTDLTATSNQSIKNYANDTLQTAIGERAYKNLQSSSQLKAISSRNTELAGQINNALPVDAEKMASNAVPDYHVMVYGNNTRNDFENLYRVAHPSEANNPTPDVFHAGNKVFVFCAEENLTNATHRADIGRQVTEASIQATIESHCQSKNIDIERANPKKMTEDIAKLRATTTGRTSNQNVRR
ncbi:hypothetical protein [Chitinivorax sp. B]|uniref:hypothetical protein n=1 Tax=Chitinivorax sp. B TaxID=2502235 RepID=UPI0010F59F00|nr:hypothetical protein [Chitinivorax sp. B]